MNHSARPHRTPSALSAVLKFILFILIFALVTLGIRHALAQIPRLSKNASVGVLEDENGAAKKRIVVIDAGHGGEDGGTSASDGTPEKDLNLSTALILADHLRAGGIEVILTRDTDRMLYDPTSDHQGRKKMLDLKARLDIARDTASASPSCEVLFVSIHMNSFPSEHVKGFQVWYSPNDPSSETLAKAVQASVCNLLQKDNDRKAKRAGSNIYLLDRLNMPAILIECGFLSNAEEAARLKDEEYRRTIAFAIFTAIVDYSAEQERAITDSIVPLTP